MSRKIKFLIWLPVFLGLGFLALRVGLVYGAMNSETYKIDADVIGTGGATGNSGNYKITDTLGQSVIGLGAGTAYKDQAGFWYMVNYYLTLNIDSETVNLGTITPGTPVTGESTLGVLTDAWGGYDLYVSQNNPMTHTDTITTIPNYSCDIDNPCLWSGTGLGFTLTSGSQIEAKWGTTPDFKYAYFPLVDTIFHTKEDYQNTEDETAVEYKVDVPSTQKSGLYSNIITYTAVSKL
jgi:hypothetical protein